MISSLLVANRGEIAVRIVRTCRELGIRSIVAYSSADRDSLACRLADASICIGPPPAKESYLNKESLLVAAAVTHCDALHPGVGFLSENADFARKVRDEGIIFMGAEADTIALLGDKIKARETARSCGLSLTPGSEGNIEDVKTCIQQAEQLGFPIILKAAAGGGGKGMRIVHSAREFADAFALASHEAESAFHDGRIYFEKYIQKPRHVEVQLAADTQGNVIHLGERDCTVQRNHQKLLEESPAPALKPETRESMCRDACTLFQKIGYVGVGTVEFLLDGEEYYFMEVNVRIQVEHPVSELLTGVDLIKEQIRIHSGEPLSYTQDQISFRGYALECRINALSPGKITAYYAPAGCGVRVDSYLMVGTTVPPFYDALIAKIIVHTVDRQTGIARMQRALSEFSVEGITTDVVQQQNIIAHQIFQQGNYGTDVLAEIEK